MECALCKTPLTDDNVSKEHIFPNAIGGRRTVKWFVCTPCNNSTGQDWDSKLAQHLKPLCTMLGVRRSRGANQSFDVERIDGTKLKYHPDGSMSYTTPTCEINESDDSTKVNITARTMKELGKKIPGIVRKHPQLSREKLLQRATNVKEPRPIFKVELEFGGKRAGKSVIKTCLAMLYSCGLNINLCEHAQSYLCGDGDPCFGYFNERDLVKNRPSHIFPHCIWIRGDSLQRQLIAYVEYFGYQRIVACLSSTYSGEEFSCGYAIDPVTGKELDIEVDIDITPDEIEKIYDYKMVDPDKTRQALESLYELVVELDRKRAMDSAI